jgi:hypothetical protein
MVPELDLKEFEVEKRTIKHEEIIHLVTESVKGTALKDYETLPFQQRVG